MKLLSDISYKQTYNKIDDNIANDFYLPSMASSLNYLRMSGYFGSTVFIIAWSSLKEFVLNNGRMRIICSPCLSKDDIIAIQEGQKAKVNEILRNSLESEFQDLLSNETLRKPFKVLSALIANGTIEIKIAYGKILPNFKQLFHDKVGIFHDGINYVSFRGSINETYKGLSDSGNIESISVFTSWENESDANRVKLDLELFERIWSNDAPGIIATSLPEDFKKTVSELSQDCDWQKLVDEISTEIEITSKWSADANNARLPRKHQIEALNNWVDNNHCGILEHATGSGKTFTSLCAIRNSFSEGKTILIFVPSSDLLKQWYEEIATALKDLSPNIMLCGDNNDSWRKKDMLKYMTSPFSSIPKITIATMDTAIRPSFISSISQGDHLFVVCDEVHRMGSPSRRKFFNINAGYKLGVSATPKRYGDPTGTNEILDYFGGIIKPIYSLQHAINDGVLTPYFYCPREVKFSSEEQKEWNELTLKIRERYRILKFSESSNIDNDQKLKALRLRRARVIKKASGKTQLAINILKKDFKAGQKWIVYCEDITQLKSVTSAILRELPHIDVREYYADMPGDRRETLRVFALYGGVIVSIKCLDEGVDIPSTTHAIILASSQNPREFIQRRGRVLRLYHGKNYSWLYDAIVIPDESDEDSVKTDILICGELARAIQFASWSKTSTADTNLRMIAAHYKIDIEELSKTGTEYE